MLKRTHIIIGVFVAMYFLPYMNNKLVFFPVVIIASLIPDIDSLIAPKKDYKIFKALKSQSYKDFMHSYTLCIFLSAILAILYPIIALPFFLGYSFHLFFDSITVYGTNPFWPFKIKTKGFIVPGGKTEKFIEYLFGIFILLLAFRYLFIIG
ncbi:MAG: metal-dependent hydrolase [Candidatus Pacearchaeota archaeon]